MMVCCSFHMRAEEVKNKGWRIEKIQLEVISNRQNCNQNGTRSEVFVIMSFEMT